MSTARSKGSVFEVNDLRWRVSDDFALSVPELNIPLGKTTLLLGPSASGKSTLLRLLGRVEGQYFPSQSASGPSPPEGQIWLTPEPGEPPVDLLALSERALIGQQVRGRKVGIVFQREGLFVDRSALDNVAWPLRALGVAPTVAAERAGALLDQVQLRPERAVGTLSGGERKRLALARALGPEPPVLLLDEPFTGLDPRALDDLLTLTEDLIAKAEGKLSVVMVTHQREDIERLGQFIVFMHQGELVAAGPRASMEEALKRFIEGSSPFPPNRHGSHDVPPIAPADAASSPNTAEIPS